MTSGTGRTRGTRGRRTFWWIVALLAPLLAVGAWVVWFSPWMSVEQIRVEVSGEVPASVGEFPVVDVEAVIDLPEGTPLLRVPTDAIVARVSALPAVRDVEVIREWPRTLVIDVQRRIPVAAVKGSGGFDLVDLEGMVVMVVADQPQDLPLVDARGAGLPAALAVAADLPAELRQRTRVIVANTRNDVTLDLRDGGRVMWGDADQAPLKADVLQALFSPEWDRYDVSSPTAPTTARSSDDTITDPMSDPSTPADDVVAVG